MKTLLLLLLILPLLTSAQPAAPPKLNIFTYGDSNGTFPYSWPVQIRQALPEADVFNISKSGKTIGFVNNGDSSLNALMTIERDLDKAAASTGSRPFDYIVMELGTNDAKAVFGARQGEVEKNLKTLIDHFKGSKYPAIAKAKVIIIAPPPYGSKADAQAKYAGGNDRVLAMSKAFKKIARKKKCLFVDGYHAGIDMETMSADGLHMNAEASRKLADLVAALVRGK